MPSTVAHPSPKRNEVSWLRLLLGLFGAPTAWAAQILMSTIISTYGCYPHQTPLAVPLWGWMHAVLTAISIGCFVIGGICAFLAWTGWQRTQDEALGSGKRTMEAGEGRTRFLSLLGALVSLLFMIAIFFTGFALALIAPC